MFKEAYDYARKSAPYTSNKHDFHTGGLNQKQQKMLEGKLGEKAFKIFLLENHIEFTEDQTSYKVRDEYDFLIMNKIKVDVKTRTKKFHTRTLEMVEQAKISPKEIYISTFLQFLNRKVWLLGWFSYHDMVKVGKIENQGYLDNYVMYDNDLRSIEELLELLKKRK